MTIKPKKKIVTPNRINELIIMISELFKGYMTSEEVSDAISKLAGISLHREDTYEALLLGYQSEDEIYRKSSTIYLVGTVDISDEGLGSVNHYDEYLYLGEKATSERPYEKIGSFSTDVDLSKYLTEDDLEEMSSSELTQMWEEAFSSD